MKTKMRRLMARTEFALVQPPWIVEEDFSARSGVERRLFFGFEVSAFSEDFRFCALFVSECGHFVFTV